MAASTIALLPAFYAAWLPVKRASAAEPAAALRAE